MDVGGAVEVRDFVVAQLDEVVAPHLQVGVVAHLEDGVGKGLKLRSLHRVEAFLPGVGALLHAGLVELRVELAHGLVQLLQRVELPSPEPRGYPVVGDAHGVFHERLLGRLPGVAGQHGDAVVVSHVAEGGVERGLVPVGLDDCGLQVVGRDYRRHAAEVLQAHAQGEEEVLRALRGDAPDEDVVAVGHATDEHLRLDHLPRLQVDIRELVAREVHHQFLTWLVGRRQHRGDVLLGHEILFQVVVELRLAVAVGVCLAVLLPQ